MGLGVDMVVSIFFSRGGILVERMLDRCACMWHLTVASYIGAYLVNWLLNKVSICFINIWFFAPGFECFVENSRCVYIVVA